MNGIESKRPTSSLYCRVTPISPMARSTTGLKAAVSPPEVFSLKYWVAALSGPLQILRASSKLISPSALHEDVPCGGAARSAARFMTSTNSSTWGP